MRIRTPAPIRKPQSLAPLWLTTVLLAASAFGCATTGGDRDLSGGQQSWRWYTLAFESLRAGPCVQLCLPVWRYDSEDVAG